MKKKYRFRLLILFELIVLFLGLVGLDNLPKITSAQEGGGTSYSLWDSSAVPTVESTTDTRAVEVGVKFQAAVDGQITAIRFYKGARNTGVHTASLWARTGWVLLARKQFLNETGSGWQQVDFDTPVSISANTTYAASYFAPFGRTPHDLYYFKSSWTNGPLKALASTFEEKNGVYRYSLTPTAPFDTYYQTNYWVDVVFVPNTTTP